MPQQQKSTTCDPGRVLTAEAVIELLTHLAVGTGPVTLVAGVLQPPPRPSAELQEEIGRTRYVERFFVEEDVGGPLGPFGEKRYRSSEDVTNLIYMRFRFEADEAAGDWSEMAVFGGVVDFVTRVGLLLDGNQAGDDRANEHVSLAGSFNLDDSQTITVTVSTGGGDGVAQVSWASTGSLPAGGPLTVDFGDPVPIGGSGLVLYFNGGPDDVLTQGDAWLIRCTTDSETPTFAKDGVYDPITNEPGQVKTSGELFRLYHMDPPLDRGDAIFDFELVVEVLNNA